MCEKVTEGVNIFHRLSFFMISGRKYQSNHHSTNEVETGSKRSMALSLGLDCW